MCNSAKSAIVLVSFGTAHQTARIRSLDAIESDLRTAFPHMKLYTAWTGKAMIAARQKKDGITVDTVKEAMDRMIADGITHVFLQPTFVMAGTEYRLLREEIASYEKSFFSLRLGAPLLDSENDCREIARSIIDEFTSLDPHDLLLLIGHGSKHGTADYHDRYDSLNRAFQETGHPNVFVGTMGDPLPSHHWLPRIHEMNPQRIILAPLMITAGGHALNDLFGDTPSSLKRQLEAADYFVECLPKGLGEYPGIRAHLIKHLSTLMEKDTI